MSNFIDFLLVISKLQSPIYCRSPQLPCSDFGFRLNTSDVDELYGGLLNGEEKVHVW